MVVEGFQHGTSRFMGVGAVAEAAVAGVVEYLLEIACQLGWLYVERAETLYSRGVNDVGGEW